jgi:long-chain acyl-CoA synthetase
VLWCRVPPHARFEYFGDPEKTRQAWRRTPEGDEFTVGDLGRIDDDGYVHLVGRREDLVITGGVNVYPTEVENTLAEHPGVSDVAVYGVPDEEWGQRVVAAVVGTATPDDLRDWCRDRLAPPKRPKEYVVLDALPRTLTGKVLRRELVGLGSARTSGDRATVPGVNQHGGGDGRSGTADQG